jgi:hypothetical protein
MHGEFENRKKICCHGNGDGISIHYMPSIHLIENENFFWAAENQIESGYWGSVRGDLQPGVGWQIYFHHHQANEAFQGGTIINVRVQAGGPAGGPYNGRKIYRFEPQLPIGGVLAGPTWDRWYQIVP